MNTTERLKAGGKPRLSARLEAIAARGEAPGIDEIANAVKLEEMLEWAIDYYETSNHDKENLRHFAAFRALPFKPKDSETPAPAPTAES